MSTSHTEAIQRASKLVDSQVALARSLQVTPVTITQLLRPPGAKNARPAPPKQCVRIEQAMGGAVTRKDLQPDDGPQIWSEASAEGWQSALTLVDYFFGRQGDAATEAVQESATAGA